MEKSKTAQIDLKTILNGAAQVSLWQSIEAFLRLEMIGKSDQTRLWYRRRLEGLAEYLGPDQLLSNIMEADLLTWYADLANRANYNHGKLKLSTYTLHGHVRAVKRFCKWLKKRDFLPVDLGKDLDLPKLPRGGRKGISESNLRAILEAASSDPRDNALLRFLESTGARVGGVASLTIGDLNLDSDNPRIRRRVTVHEKGDKERSVILTSRALEALKGWLEIRPEVPGEEHVFLGSSPGQPWHALTSRGIASIIERYKVRLGLLGKCSPHEWRHRWCRKRLQEGMDLSQVSQLAGHEDVSVTVRFYGQFTLDQLQEAYDRFVQDPEGD